MRQHKFFTRQRAAFTAVSSLTISLVLGFSGQAQAQTASTIDSVEFFNSKTGQYYRTDIASEITAIDQNSVASGWARTGQSYKLWRTQARAIGCAW